MTERLGKRLPDKLRWARSGVYSKRETTRLMDEAERLTTDYSHQIGNLDRVINDGRRIKKGEEVEVFLSPRQKKQREKERGRLELRLKELQSAKTGTSRFPKL